MKSDSSYALFDFADTVAELIPRRQKVVAEHILQIADICIPEKHIAYCYKLVDVMMQYSSLRTRTDLQRAEFYRKYNQRLLASLGVLHKVTPESLFGAFDREKKHWALKPGVKQSFAGLRKRGYKIGIISNFDTRLEQIVYEALGLGDMIDFLHISQSEGIEKPDLRFYLSFFERHNIPIKQSFYIGDNFTLDFMPATQIELKVWLLDEEGLYDYCPTAVRSISDFIAQLP
jgi:FMN phosphatase YigB (HAD superfamily)